MDPAGILDANIINRLEIGKVESRKIVLDMRSSVSSISGCAWRPRPKTSMLNADARSVAALMNPNPSARDGQSVCTAPIDERAPRPTHATGTSTAITEHFVGRCFNVHSCTMLAFHHSNKKHFCIYVLSFFFPSLFLHSFIFTSRRNNNRLAS